MRALFFGLVLLVPSLALAQEPATPALAAHAQVLPPVVVHGTVQRPHVYVFLPRAHVRFDRTDAHGHAVDRIVDSVTHAPF